MRRQSAALEGFLRWLTLSVGFTFYLEALRLIEGTSFSWKLLVGRFAFAAGLLLVACWTRPRPSGKSQMVWPWSSVAVVGMGGLAAVVYFLNEATWAAWALLFAVYLLLFGLDRALTYGVSAPWQWGIRGVLSLAGGFIPVFIAQIESNFADEEFFVALQALVLGLLWFLLLGTRDFTSRSDPSPARYGVRLGRRWLSLFLLLFSLIGLGGTLRAYQRSFYPVDAPSYPGVSREAPFVCGEVESTSRVVKGEQVFSRLLARVEANPRKGTPEYGMLALGTGEQRWAQMFHESLLKEAKQGLYTGPAHSVKSVQHEAALRVYYFPHVHAAFPDLFSDEETALLEKWFAAINRRALTVEWVDWMYALAFTKWPEGPYENQDNGAGLLALLEFEGLAAPNVSSTNRDYLAGNPRGWEDRFRVIDDAYIYQREWITNAYFQSLYIGSDSTKQKQLSFEWLLLQALPDGTPLRYNHPASPSPAGIAYLGARLTGDPRYIWWADRALAAAEREGKHLSAQPGVEAPVALVGRSPTAGSCLLYGDSGLSNQMGPLAPDKIIFRDGWSEDSAYLLLNLRFTGWHRYKASNTVTLVYQDAPLVGDVSTGRSFGWLPEGRSLFRDKRIPRENLNGLLVERTGMSSVLHTLTGAGGLWAQDPPYYAEVMAVETGNNLDLSHTCLVNWRGWRHDRRIYFYHDENPIVITDEAAGPPGRQAAIAWHLSGVETIDHDRVRLQTGESPVEVLFVPLNSGGQLDIEQKDGDNLPLRALYRAPISGRLNIATIFLPRLWLGARAVVDREEGTLQLSNGRETIVVPLHTGDPAAGSVSP